MGEDGIVLDGRGMYDYLCYVIGSSSDCSH